MQLSFSKFGHPPGVDSRRFKKLIRSPKTKLWNSEYAHTANGSELSTEFIPLGRHVFRRIGNDLDLFIAEDSEYEEEEEKSSDAEEKMDAILPSEQLVSSELEVKVKAEPARIEAWLDLLDHSLMMSSNSGANPPSTAKIAISILQRALKAAAANIHSLALWSNYLFYAEEVWATDRLQLEWETAVNKVNNNYIWLSWLSFRLRASGIDIHSTLISDGPRALKHVKEEGIKLMIFWRILLSLQESGTSTLCSTASLILL